MENNFSSDGGGDGLGMIQVHYIYYVTADLTRGRAIIRAMGSSCKYRWSSTRWPTTNLLLCVTQFLTGHGLVLVFCSGVGDPRSKVLAKAIYPLPEQMNRRSLIYQIYHGAAVPTLNCLPTDFLFCKKIKNLFGQAPRVGCQKHTAFTIW